MPDLLTLFQISPDSIDALGWMPSWASTPLSRAMILWIIIGGAAVVAHFFIRPVALAVLRYLANKSPVEWDDILIEKHVWRRLTILVPLIVIRTGLAVTPEILPGVHTFLERFIGACMILVVARTIDAFLNAVNALYERSPDAHRRPIKSYVQLAKLFMYIIAIILIVAHLAGQSPWFFLGGIGAMTAVLMLVFRDTLLSLVASIQLANNDLLQLGDWIEMPQFNADGDVIDIALHTVKVKNWDKTVTVVPTHKFLENSFKNWRGMHETGGRRIKRSIYVNMASVRFLEPDEITRFARFSLLKEYITDKQKELAEYNVPFADNPDAIVNARRLTNLGTFRAYIANYLKTHPHIHQEMTQLVRQLQPAAEGIPLEIYAFTNNTKWAFYEATQSDIFDHILAIAPEFGIDIYQHPAGRDVRGALEALREEPHSLSRHSGLSSE